MIIEEWENNFVQHNYATEREIIAQPGIWREWARQLPDIAMDIRNWIIGRRPDEIWLCGAGTSSFIGECLATVLSQKIANIPVRAIASTDLVARPHDYLGKAYLGKAYLGKAGDNIRNNIRPLVISFGRSGNSSESVGTLDILDRECPDADRLHITCNKDSQLAKRLPLNSKRAFNAKGELDQQRVIILPDASHDEGFAMTSSYTTMMLTALACLDDCPLPTISDYINALADQGDALLAMRLDERRPERAIFLGSGPFTGLARESALKVLELTAGKVITAWESTLGFRHGPKAVINADSAVYIFLSNDPLTRKYDQDIVDEIRRQFPETRVTSIGSIMAGYPKPDIDHQIDVNHACNNDVWNCVLYVIVAQRLAVAWSRSLGLHVDNPFEDGNLTRVVSGVTLYAS